MTTDKPTDKPKTYRINEIFYSLQGEGIRAGTANVFIRFSGCNMKCDVEPGPQSPGGFACDTEFVSGRDMTLQEIHQLIAEVVRGDDITKGVPCEWLILTGGEPALQVDVGFIDYFHSRRFKLAIETNGSVELPTYCQDKNLLASGGETDYELGIGNSLLDWITVSPKVAEHAIKQKYAHEVKYVRGYGQGIPRPVVQAEHYLISPAFQGNELDRKTLDWCVQLCLAHPKWRLSVQQHKQLFGGIR